MIASYARRDRVRIDETGRLTRLILQLIKSLSSFCDLCDILPHYSDGVVDLGLDGRRFGSARSGTRACAGRGATAGEIWVVRLRPACATSTGANSSPRELRRGREIAELHVHDGRV